MKKFFTNFLLAFATFMAFVLFVAGAALGPIMFVIWIGLSPFPYGLPIVFLIWGIFVGFFYAAGEHIGWDEK